MPKEKIKQKGMFPKGAFTLKKSFTMKPQVDINIHTLNNMNSSTTDVKFDADAKMQNYDFSALYAEYMYDKNCRTSKIIYGFGDNASLPTFEQTLKKHSREFSQEEQEKNIKTVFDRLPRCGSYLFDEACFAVIPEFAKQEFLDIYMKYKRELYKKIDKIEYDPKSMIRALDILSERANDLTDYEKEKLEYMYAVAKDKPLYEKLQKEAMNEYFAWGNGTQLFEVSIERRSTYKFVILLNFLLRHFELPSAIKELADLRTKIRETLNLEPDEYVGF